MTELVLSSAFANSAGVKSIAGSLIPIAAQCRVFVGVRNGSTTAQALAALLALGVRLYAVDTATRTPIFHPKLYLATGETQARAIIGSANLTHPGLFNNIEAGADIKLDLDDEADRAFVQTFLDGLQHLSANFPDHCFRVTTGRQIIELMRQGLLEDERNPKTDIALGAGKQGASTSKPRIGLPFTPPPKNKRARKPKPPQVGPGASISAPPPYGQLVWTKPNLPESDLQLNAGHAPGVLRLTQAGYQINGQTIDQTTYFRNQVFAQLPWAFNQAANKDMATAPISLVIAGVYVGDFDLPVSHKAGWEAGQGNYTTGLHWDDATGHIKKPGLVGRTLRLYEPANPQGRFIVEID